MTLDPNILLALGVPSLIAALAYAFRKGADGWAKRGEAEKTKADAAKIAAEAGKEREEVTGRFAKMAEDGYRDAREDLSECEQVREALRIEIDGERRARITLAAECSQREKSAERNIAALRGRVEELERRSVRPEA